MPTDYLIDHVRRIVLVRARGSVTIFDLFAYQKRVWSEPDVAGYDELLDMSGIENMVAPSTGQILEASAVSASIDGRHPGARFAIVAPSDFFFGVARMFEAHRNLDPRSARKVNVFRSSEEAFAFLDRPAPKIPEGSARPFGERE